MIILKAEANRSLSQRRSSKRRSNKRKMVEKPTVETQSKSRRMRVKQAAELEEGLEGEAAITAET